jgi:hypothetical protein
VRQYPDLEGRPARMIDCPEQPTDAIAALLAQAAPSLSEFGISLSLNVRGLRHVVLGLQGVSGDVREVAAPHS